MQVGCVVLVCRFTGWAAPPEWAELAESVWLLVSLLRLHLGSDLAHRIARSISRRCSNG